jgi:hypothetical protein
MLGQKLKLDLNVQTKNKFHINAISKMGIFDCNRKITFNNKYLKM